MTGLNDAAAINCVTTPRKDGRRNRRRRRLADAISRARSRSRRRSPRNRKSGIASMWAVLPLPVRPRSALYAGLAVRPAEAAHTNVGRPSGRRRPRTASHQRFSCPSRAADRRSASFRRILRTVCGRFQRTVEARNGSIGYLFERAASRSRSTRSIRSTCLRPARTSVRARSTLRGVTPVASFTFTPPGGYQFQSNQVNLPLGNREGFFVVEARRGDVGEQVWINRTRVGLVSKETPGGFLLYGMDLGTGMPLARMRVQFVVHNTIRHRDDRRRRNRPLESFVASGFRARAMGRELCVSQPVAASAGSAGDRRRARRFGGRARGRRRARCRLRAPARRRRFASRKRQRRSSVYETVLARSSSRHVTVDEAGAFSTALSVPSNAPAGDYTVLAQVSGGATGGASVHVDANAGALSLGSDVPLPLALRSDATTCRCTCTRRKPARPCA